MNAQDKLEHAEALCREVRGELEKKDVPPKIVGRRYQMKEKSHQLYGTLLTLVEDDGTSIPHFELGTGARIVCAMHRLELLPEEEHLPEGLKVGDVFQTPSGPKVVLGVNEERTEAELSLTRMSDRRDGMWRAEQINYNLTAGRWTLERKSPTYCGLTAEQWKKAVDAGQLVFTADQPFVVTVGIGNDRGWTLETFVGD